MIQDTNTMAAVDVGASKVCAIIARREGARGVSVLSRGVVPSEGLDRGNVIDPSQAGEVIGKALAAAGGGSSAPAVGSAYVGVTGSHVVFENRADRVDWAAAQGVITRSDLDKMPETISEAAARPGQKVIHALPINYVLDGQSGIRDPLGMHAKRLEVESHVISAKTRYVENLERAVGEAGLAVQSLVLEPIASANAVLTESEKYNGAVLIDIGGGTSDIIVVRRGMAEFISVLPIGGFQFTNDICVAFRTPYPAAEEAKLKYGTTDPVTYSALDEIQLPQKGRLSSRTVTLRDLSQLMRERAAELVRLIRLRIIEAGIEDPGAVSIVLTGGSSRLPGLDEMARRIIGPNVRVGGANPPFPIPDELRGPEFATGVGLVAWALDHPSVPLRPPTASRRNQRNQRGGGQRGGGNPQSGGGAAGRRQQRQPQQGQPPEKPRGLFRRLFPN